MRERPNRAFPTAAPANSPSSRLEALVDRLRRFYGVLSPPPHDPFMLFVWEVLSVQSSPRRRDLALGRLKRARALTPDSMARAPRKTLQEAVSLAGPHLERRLAALAAGADMFRRTPTLGTTIRGPVGAARRALRPLPQMRDGGAYRMLLFAADHLVMPIDSKVCRVARRLGFGERRSSSARTAVAVRHALTRELPHDTAVYRAAFLYISHHAEATCTERDPHCPVCPILDGCPEGKKRTVGL